MYETPSTIDLSTLKTLGVQHLRGVFPMELKADFARRAQQIIAARADGTLSTFDQDSRGFGFDWFEPLLRHPMLVTIAKQLYGADVCGSGWRILAKDKHYKGAMHIHQDWAYNGGDTRKLTMFVPLTPVNTQNGGLSFLERSHLIGPVSMGPLDPSRFPPMNHATPEMEVGDLLLCDFLTWHYSNASLNGEERIMLQLNYQPATDPSSKYLVSGKPPHDFSLAERLDASSAPSVYLNAKIARRAFDSGDADKALRYTRGLLWDDPDHAGAALLMYDILAKQNDPAAAEFLAQARISARQILNGVAEREGRTPQDGDMPMNDWAPLDVRFHSRLEDVPHSESLPARLATPKLAWDYGAVSYPIGVGEKPATVRIRAQALTGNIGWCLLNMECNAVASDAHVITPDAGMTTIMINVNPARHPARLVIRNHDDQGRRGDVMIDSIEVLEYA